MQAMMVCDGFGMEIWNVVSKKQQFQMERMAYLKHNDCFDLERDVVEIEKFDGFSYASWRANAVYRTLEDMCDEGLLTEREYRECKV